jgi:hypothetical protein
VLKPGSRAVATVYLQEHGSTVVNGKENQWTKIRRERGYRLSEPRYRSYSRTP